VEHSNFQHAFELANLSAKHKLPDIHLKKAVGLSEGFGCSKSKAAIFCVR
jgi:hypothetical protein